MSVRIVSKMSNQDKITSEIQQGRAMLAEIDSKLDLIIQKLKADDISDEDEAALLEEFDNLQYQHIDISADIAMLQEMLDKRYYEAEEYEDDDENERYDSWDEVFTGGDY